MGEVEKIEKQKRKALRNTLLAIALVAVSLVFASWQWREANRAKKESCKEFQRAQQEFMRAERLINAINFYDDKFALVVKDSKSYYVDKTGGVVEKLGFWKKADTFDISTGLAKVVNDNETVFLLDTLGTKYKYSDNISNLDRTIEALDLSGDNPLKFPGEIRNRTNLKVLNLSSKGLKSLPPEIGSFTGLTRLDLSGNEITSLPSEIGNLSNLTWLNLSGNEITSLPPEIGNLTNLTWLDLSCTKITSLPPEIEKLPGSRIINHENTPLDSLSKLTIVNSIDLKK